jgi:hypothetical protein
MTNNGFTPTEHRIMEVLQDGLPHTREEIHACLSDELSSLDAIKPHICSLRPKLESRGLGIQGRRKHYQLIGLGPKSLPKQS